MSKAMMSVSEAVVTRQLDQIDALRRIATQRTPENEIRERVGRGGMKLKYTDGAYVIRTLNEAFGWDWDFVADHEELLMNGDKPFEVKVRGTLTVRLNGQAVTKTQYGSQPIETIKDGSKPVSIGDCYKGAATDAMKKCASLLGIALDLYDSDYRADKYVDEPPPWAGTACHEDDEPAPEPVRNVKLEGAQPTSPADILRGHCRKLGFSDAALLRWLTHRYGLYGTQTLTLALSALKPEEMSQAIDIFREKLENGGK